MRVITVRRYGKFRYHALSIFDMMMHTLPDPTGRLIVAPKSYNPDLMATLGQTIGEVVPAPGTMPGTMD